MSNRLTKKIVSIILTATTVLTVSGIAAFVPQTAKAVTIEELQAQIALLLAQLAQLKGTPSSSAVPVITRFLTLGSTDAATGGEVSGWQNFLVAQNKGAKAAALAAAFSGGIKTGYFGNATGMATQEWQTSQGISPTAPRTGPKTIAAVDALRAVTPPPGPPGTPPPPTPAGTGITVNSGAQLGSGMLHVDNAVRVPYTAVIFTASSDGDVKIDSLTVERQGASTDATFSGVILLDENGVQVGLEKTLNSNHQAVLSEPFTVKAGQSRTMWIAANRTTGGTTGTQAFFALVAVSSAAQVHGSFPIVGTTRTINVAGLAIGTVTVATGPAKSVATTTEEAGKTMVFTAVKVTAGSVEDVSLKAIRFNQVGTIGTNDISNLEVKVDGTVYPHTVSSDGKYFTARFTNGITVTKGNSAEVTISGTLSGGTNRTVKFDVYRMTDIAVDGKLFGYGINPTAGTGFTSTNPVYWASQVTVGKATMSVEKDPNVAAQNVAINLSDQPIGGFIIEVKGEPISVASLVFRVSPTNVSGGSNEDGSNVDQIKVVNQTGQILAGPVDAVAAGTVTFTDTVTFPVGKTNIKLLAKLDTAFDNNDTITSSTTPSSNWTTVTGVSSGETIAPTPSSAVTANTMTVKGSSLSLSVSPSPIAQTVVAGITGFTFANYLFDAQSSGEDIRMSSVPLAFAAHSGATATNLTNCQLYDGANSVTTGTNVVNPSATASSTTFTFDGSGLVIPKGVTKTMALKCNIAGGGTGDYSWGIDSAASFSGTGLTSGQSLTPAATDNDGQKMTLASSGSYAVTDDSTPGYRIVSGGATGVTLTRLKLSALNENVDVRQIRLQLTTSASNTPLNLAGQMVTLYDEAAPTVAIGTAQFGAGGTVGADMATTTINAGTLIIPKGGNKIILVKGDIAAITADGPMTRSGDLLKVDYDGTLAGSGNGGNYGVGQSSGTEISPSGGDTSVQGVRIMKGYPVFTKCTGGTSGCDTLPSNVLRTVTNFSSYRFKVAAVGSDVRIAKFTFNVSSSTGAASAASSTKYSIYAYTDGSFSSADTSFSGTGLLNASQCYVNAESALPVANTVGLGGQADIEIFPDAAGTACGATAANHSTTTYKVPAGQTRYFDLRVDYAAIESGTGSESITIVLRGDSAFPTAHQDNDGVGEMGRASALGAAEVSVDSDSNDDLIWSPNSTSSSPTIADFDFTNGYQVVGLPANDMPGETITSAN